MIVINDVDNKIKKYSICRIKKGCISSSINIYRSKIKIEEEEEEEKEKETKIHNDINYYNNNNNNKGNTNLELNAHLKKLTYIYLHTSTHILTHSLVRLSIYNICLKELLYDSIIKKRTGQLYI